MDIPREPAVVRASFIHAGKSPRRSRLGIRFSLLTTELQAIQPSDRFPCVVQYSTTDQILPGWQGSDLFRVSILRWTGNCLFVTA